LSTRRRTDGPYPIIAREGWPFLVVAVLASAIVTWFWGWWSAPLWLATLFILQFFRDPPRAVPEDPAAA
jgi:phosphatidylserine decarboxylase